MKRDLRLLVEITLIMVGVVAYGVLGTALALAFAVLIGWGAGLLAMFIYIVLTMFVWIRLDERGWFLPRWSP